jgi:hypothetical protein
VSVLCLAAAGLAVTLPLQAFTLAWTHSIEKIRWEEDYRIVDTDQGARLALTEARIRGSGAGMEPPADAILKDGVWHYRPALAPQREIRLARSPYVADYQFCTDGGCRPMQDIAGPADQAPELVLRPCAVQ